ncbi:MAG: hypothetical protein QGD96_09395 [Anaerolineae bacterium]|nr:hypothetical protein [Anaerolineae bacterium]
MFDNLRDDNSTSYYEDSASDLNPVKTDSSKSSSSVYKKGKIFGMTAFQRFIISSMLLIAVFSLGTMCLFLTGKIGLP